MSATEQNQPTGSFAVVDETIASQVIRVLRNDIITNKIKAGSRITIREISERYGVSPMPVREAFRTLEGENLLEIEAYKGATVLRIDTCFIRETYGISRMLETLLTEEAMIAIDEEGIRKLRTVNGGMEKTLEMGEPLDDYVELNTHFHEIINSYSTNRKAARLLAYQQSLIAALRTYYTPSQERIRTAVREHDRIISALMLKDKFLVLAAIEEHSNSALENFVRQFEENR